MENTLTKKQYPAIDIMKFVMAILVINIHKPIVSYDVLYVNLILRTAIGSSAVPFFFICSAFFLFKKFTDDVQKNKAFFLSFLKRMFILYTLWTVIYLPCMFVKSFTGHYDEITLKLLIGQCASWIKNFFLSQSFIHFWYMNTLILSAVFVFLLLKKLSPKAVLVISLAVYVTSNALYSLNIYDASIRIADIYASLPIVLKNTLSIGFLCVSLGAYFAMNKPKLSFKISTIFSVLMIFISIVQNIILEPYSDVALPLTRLTCIIAAYFIFSMCATSNLANRPIFSKLRSYSSLMYFSHLLLMSEGLSYLAKITGIDAFATSYPLAFFLSVILFLGFAMLITELQKKKHFHWLKYLY